MGLVVASVACQHYASRGALPLALLMLGVAIWSGAYAVMWWAPTLEQQAFWVKVTSLGLWMIPVGYLVLAFDIAELKRWHTRGRIALISITSFALTNVEWLNPGRLFDSAFVARTMGPHTHYAVVPGPLYWVFVVFSYALIVVAFAIIFRAYRLSSGAKRTQAAILLVGGLVPFVASVATELGSLPLGDLDLAPLAFLVTGALWLTAILRGTLLDILPLARDVLVEQMPDGVFIVDGEGLIADANPAALSVLRRPRVEVLGKPADAILSCVKGAAALLGDSAPRSAVLPINSNGNSRYVDLAVTPLAVGNGGPPAQLVTLRDVTEERRAIARLELARTVFDTAHEGIVVALPNADERAVDVVIDVNDAFCRLTGYSREDVVGKDMNRIYCDRHAPAFYKAMENALFAAGEWKGEVWQSRIDGTAFLSWLSLSAAKDDHGHVEHVVGVFTDITEIREAEEKLRHSATHDALTGLPNRLLLEDRLEHALAQARRVGGKLAVLYVNLDNFKDVNDTLGHAQGDALLIEIAQRFVATLRDTDTIGRHGGDEFTVIVTDIEDPAQVEVTARRLLTAIASPCCLSTGDVHITASIGIAIFPTDGVDASSLTQHAGVALRGAKELGSNEVQFFSEEFQRCLSRRMTVEKEIRYALEKEQCFLLYQPQVDLSTGRITGAEALVRMRSKDGNVLSPAEFIPIAEGSNLIIRIGDWVLHRACAEFALLHEIAPDLVISLNFSARQFRELDVTVLHDVLRAFAVNPQCLVLEITETAFVARPQEAAAKLADLRDVVGIGVSLDDFGTGYSSLTHVRMFHAGTIKIDRSFVQLLPDDPEAQAIVLSTIALARGLGAAVVAEGPETEGQVRFLRANGCDYAQGFYFSRPVPADELALLLRREPFPLPAI